MLKKYIFPFNGAKSLNTTENSHIANRNKVFDRVVDPVDRAIKKFKNPRYVLIMNDRIFLENQVSFTEVSQSDIKKEVKNLNAEKATTHKNIPHREFKVTAEVTAETLQQLFNQALTTREYMKKKTLPIT